MKNWQTLVIACDHGVRSTQGPDENWIPPCPMWRTANDGGAAPAHLKLCRHDDRQERWMPLIALKFVARFEPRADGREMLDGHQQMKRAVVQLDALDDRKTFIILVGQEAPNDLANHGFQRLG